MTSERDVERRVEEWLEDEARPMPHDVLEGALEAVTRTSQVGTRRFGPAWLSSRSMVVVAAATVLILVVVAGGLAVDRIGSLLPTESASAGPVQVWDPVADWLSAPNHQNPSPDSYGNPGVWSYMRSTSASHDPTNYLLMPNFEGDHAWNQPGMTNLPDFLGEAWNEPAMINEFVGLGAANAAIYLHPTPGAHAVLAWTSPVAGEVTIDGVVARPQDPCSSPGGGLLFSVDRGSETLRSIGLDHGQRAAFNLSTTVGRGDTVYFIVDPGADGLCDLTSLQVTITFE